MIKNVVLVKSEATQADDDLAHNLRAHIDGNYESIKVIDHITQGTEKLENKFKNPDHIIMLWTKSASEDTDFLLSVLHAERTQLEQRTVKCINVRLEEGVQISHLKQESHILSWFQTKDLVGLAKKISEIMGDKNNKVTERIGNVSEGLVWNYFVVYLKSILPDIPEATRKWIQENERTMSSKFMLVIPLSGKCSQKFSDVMPEVYETAGTLTSVWVDDAGQKDRAFNPNIHKVRSGADSQDWFYFSGEFCNPVNTIYQLYQEYDKVSDTERRELIGRFSQRLKYILGHKENAKFHGHYHIIDWDDLTPNATSLSNLLIEACSQ